MTGPKPSARQQLLDDQLLDALARASEPPDGADALVAGLAAWRGELASQPLPAALDLATVLPPGPAVDRSRSRWRRLVAGAGAALVVAGGGGAVTVAAAAGAGPDSPLWPITQLVHPDRAEARLAQLAIEQVEQVEAVVAEARQAVVEGRYADAGRLLGEAEQLAAELPADGEQRRLLAEVAQVRTLFPAEPLPAPGELPTGELPPAGELPTGELPPLPESGTDPAAPEPPPAGESSSDPRDQQPEPSPDPDPDPTPDPIPGLPLPPLPSPPTVR